MKIERNDTKEVIPTLKDIMPGMCFTLEDRENKVFMMTDNIDNPDMEGQREYINLEDGTLWYSGVNNKAHLLNAKVVVEDQK